VVDSGTLAEAARNVELEGSAVSVRVLLAVLSALFIKTMTVVIVDVTVNVALGPCVASVTAVIVSVFDSLLLDVITVS